MDPENKKRVLAHLKSIRERIEMRKDRKQNYWIANEDLATLLRVPMIEDHVDENMKSLLWLMSHPPSGYTSNGDIEFLLESLEKRFALEDANVAK